MAKQRACERRRPVGRGSPASPLSQGPRHPCGPASLASRWGWHDALRILLLLCIEGTCLTSGASSGGSSSGGLTSARGNVNLDNAAGRGAALITPLHPLVLAGACFNSSEHTLQLACPRGHMIQIARTFFGHSRVGRCGYSEGDCVLKDSNSNDCAGRRNCTVNLPSGRLGRVLPHCQLRSTYIQVEYACVPASRSVNICDHSEVTTQTGYIHSPRYPLNYPTKLNCRISIRVFPQQTLRVYAIDLQLNPKTNACADSLYLQDLLHTHTICGGSRHNDELFRSLDNEITLTFLSNGTQPKKGFWLYYEANPIITTTSPKPATEKTTSTIRAATDTTHSTAPPSGPTLLSVHTSSSSTSQILQDSSNVKRKQQRDLSIEAIIGGVLGSLLVILLLLLLLLLIKRRRENKFIQSSSSQQLNPSVVNRTSNIVSYPWDASKLYDIEEVTA